jgi:hypothetical protein
MGQMHIHLFVPQKDGHCFWRLLQHTTSLTFFCYRITAKK